MGIRGGDIPMINQLREPNTGELSWSRLALTTGFLNVVFAGLLHYIQIDGPFYLRPFNIVMGLLSILVTFGLGYGAVKAYSKIGLYIPGTILVIFFFWSLAITFYHFPGDIFAGPMQGFDPFSLRPVPYLFKWIPMGAVILVGGGCEYIVNRFLNK